jgi:hypothetical protein
VSPFNVSVGDVLVQVADPMPVYRNFAVSALPVGTTPPTPTEWENRIAGEQLRARLGVPPEQPRIDGRFTGVPRVPAAYYNQPRRA